MTIRRCARRPRGGTSTLSFAMLFPFMFLMLVGMVGIGVNLLRTQRTTQVSRDAGHMYARGAEASSTGFQQLVANLGSSIGLSTTPSKSNAVVILSALTYVDAATCQAAGCKLDKSGDPIGCTNWKEWVFTQRLVIGDSNMRTSEFGSPLRSGPDGVTLDSQGKIAIKDYVLKAGAKAHFSTMNPYKKALDGSVSGLPSGQQIYISEAASRGMGLPPVTPLIVTTYAYSVF